MSCIIHEPKFEGKIEVHTYNMHPYVHFLASERDARGRVVNCRIAAVTTSVVVDRLQPCMAIMSVSVGAVCWQRSEWWQMHDGRGLQQFITFRVRCSQGEMYIGHGRLCVCGSSHSHITALTRM